ncbi:23S rRNA (uracil(1939)-C(5))-methyltransferase RlmD [Paenibacillus periandrae]|uniref:23S rRNA (uracil(1939)-C(5))-methyltransferase RlmD n=1 Tax=Paenibacillus periandrae TaxID=1761741 RepID=UPI001F08913A|nr:23S rRNA (uracil(1939)-C(5))-methyltransferase RlmD [Paenibacillus periandrae]
MNRKNGKSGYKKDRSGKDASKVGSPGARLNSSRGLNNRTSPSVDTADLPVVRNEEYEAEIVGIGHEGEGVGRVNGFTLFIKGALPGERALVKVMKLKKQYGYAKLLRIVKSSPDRIKAPCPIYVQCGGCQLQHLSYEAQLRFKRQLVVDNLERIGKLKVAGIGEKEADANGGIVVHAAIGMNDPWRYRNKAQVPIGQAGAQPALDLSGSGEAVPAVMEGGLVGGFYAQGTHRIIDMEACLIQQENNDRVVSEVKRIARELGIRPYNEETHKGLLRHVVARYGFNTGDIMVVLITNGHDIPHKDELVGLLHAAIPGIKSICQNVNREQTNVIFGEQTKVLWGDDVIYDTIGDIRFAISARSFFQVNPVQTEVLYGKALEFADLSGEETVIDAYCGIGTISLFLAQRARQVYGVEIVEEAIDDARRNALLNGIRNVQFEAGPAEVVIPEWRRKGISPDVIVVDPPRKGCDAGLLSTILEMQPKRVVYVSCNPSTLARDLRVLEDGGYRAVEVQPVDMFPHTVHVESVALLVRNGTDR